MSFGIRRQKPAALELRRVVRKQLALAVEELSGPQAADEATIHEARRRIKKVRAALRLCREGLGDEFRRANRRLRRASRRLGPIADSEALGRCFDALAANHPHQLRPVIVAAVQRYLREALTAVDARAASEQVIPRVVHRLADVRQRLEPWPLEGDSVALVRAGFEKTVRRVHAAMLRAGASGTRGRYHDWRRRVKDHWLQLRLLGPRCPDGLAGEIARLAQLDELLGQAHDLALLAGVVDDGMPLSRDDTAMLLRVIHRETWQSRHAALALAAVVYVESPEAAAARIAQAWQPADTIVSGNGRPPCQLVA